MSQTTDLLLFSTLLVLVAIWQILSANLLRGNTGLIVGAALLVGLIAVVASLLQGRPTDDEQSD